jgi:hypothetical protein
MATRPKDGGMYSKFGPELSRQFCFGDRFGLRPPWAGGVDHLYDLAQISFATAIIGAFHRYGEQKLPIGNPEFGGV